MIGLDSGLNTFLIDRPRRQREAVWKAEVGRGAAAAYVHRKVRAAVKRSRNDAHRAIEEVAVSLWITGG